ncbi:MAG: DUF1501 domain-containing protein [Pirellulales bacterium]
MQGRTIKERRGSGGHSVEIYLDVRLHFRDHRRRAQGGTAYVESDEFAYKTVENPVYCYDLHATALHLLGIDHTKLTHNNNSIDRRLTDVHGHVIREILNQGMPCDELPIASASSRSFRRVPTTVLSDEALDHSMAQTQPNHGAIIPSHRLG